MPLPTIFAETACVTRALFVMSDRRIHTGSTTPTLALTDMAAGFGTWVDAGDREHGKRCMHNLTSKDAQIEVIQLTAQYLHTQKRQSCRLCFAKCRAVLLTTNLLCWLPRYSS